MSAPAPISTGGEPLAPVAVPLKEVRRETADTFTWVIAPEDLPAGYVFRPGQFNMLYAFGVGEVPISISGDPDAPGLVHTIRAVGRVTNVMHTLEAGATVGLRGPYGAPWPVGAAEGRDLLVIAGGIGLAPLRPVLYEAVNRPERFGRVTLLYGARTPADLLYAEQLREWKASGKLQVYITVDREAPGWGGSVGVVTRLLDRAKFDPATAVAMTCGPEIMTRFVARDLEARGLSTDRCYVTMERNMKCAVGTCGHCQYGPDFICKDGPVFSFAEVDRRFGIREV